MFTTDDTFSLRQIVKSMMIWYVSSPHLALVSFMYVVTIHRRSSGYEKLGGEAQPWFHGMKSVPTSQILMKNSLNPSQATEPDKGERPWKNTQRTSG